MVRPVRVLASIAILAVGSVAVPALSQAATTPPVPEGFFVDDAFIPERVPTAWWNDVTDPFVLVDGQWAANPEEETSFEVQRCTGATCEDFVTVGSAPAGLEQWGDFGVLEENTAYRYRMRAVNAAGASAWTQPDVGATTWQRPNTPTGLTVTPAAGGIQLAWQDTATNETHYTVERCEQMSCSALGVIARLGPDSTSFVDTTAVPGGRYTYGVQSWRHTSFGGYTAFVTLDLPAVLAGPTSLSARAVSSTSVVLSWRASGAGPQEVFRMDPSSSEGWVKVATLARRTNRFTDRGLISGLVYGYAVRVATASGYSNVAQTSAQTP